MPPSGAAFPRRLPPETGSARAVDAGLVAQDQAVNLRLATDGVALKTQWIPHPLCR